MKDPNEYIENLSASKYEDLLADINVYRLLDEENRQKEFWDDVATICKYELKMRRDSGRDDAVHTSVQNDVMNTFKVSITIFIL